MYPRVPQWLIAAIDYIRRKRLYFIVPLAALTISNYWKDWRISELEGDVEVLNNTVSALVANQISRAGIIEETELIFWVKELVGDDFVVIYVSPAYKRFLPTRMNRYQLLGRTGRFIDMEFGEIYQRNDYLAYELSEPRIFREPYREHGTGPVLAGDFLKGKLEKSGNRKLVFGAFVRKSKDQKSKFK